MEALHLVYQHWFITCIFLVFSAPIAYGLAVALGGLILKLRVGK